MMRFLLTLVATVAALAAGGQELALKPDGQWSLRGQGAWKLRVDHRDLIAMAHPWSPSEKGAHARATRVVRVPEDWQGPISLHFYCSDDYNTDDRKPDGSWLTAEGFVGHRFKQVLVDDRIVWNEDIADPVSSDAATAWHRIDLAVKPSQTFLLSLLVYDAEPSATQLPGDFYQPGDSGLTRETDQNATRFASHVYWGDLMIAAGEVVPAQGHRPAEARVEEIHAKRWPLPPFGDGWKEARVPLEMRLAVPVPDSGFPVRQGLPLPAGKANEPNEVRFITKGGTPVFAQKEVTARWPDGSIRWLGVDLLVKPGMEALSLEFKRDKTAAPAGLRASDTDGNLKIESSAISLEASLDAGIHDIARKDKPVVSTCNLELHASGQTIAATLDSLELLDSGPLHAGFVLNGRFETTESHFASFSLYGHVWNGVPYLKAVLRVFNDSSIPLTVEHLLLRFTLPSTPTDWNVSSDTCGTQFKLIQKDENNRKLNDLAADVSKPVYAAWADGGIAVRRFQELFPKAMQGQDTELILDLAAADAQPTVFTQGEALTHEIWLTTSTSTTAQMETYANQPILIQNAEFLCATGTIGPAAPDAPITPLSDFMTKTFKNKTWTELGQTLGLRHFPDNPYIGGLPNWSNDYYSRSLNLWSEWFMSGDAEWFDRALDQSAHVLDVAVIHAEVPGQDWMGAIHGPGANHVPGPWAPTLRATGLELYHKLTRDPDARTAFMNAADYCIRSAAGLDSPSIRSHAGPFDTICTAYWETEDVAFLDEGTKRVEAAAQRIDTRRGAWPEAHGSRVYRGNVPWMAAQLARPLYWWYTMTGDVKAAQLLVGLAESIICENTNWDQPGAVSGYSHNPHFEMTARYDLSILPMFFAAYELTEDSFFLDAAKALWERWLGANTFDGVFNVHWNTPWALHYVRQYGLTPTAAAEAPAATQASGGS